MKTQLLGSKDTDTAARIIRSGGLAAVPTETVYGLAANGLDGSAVKKIYEVKGRPENKPISLLVSGVEALDDLGKNVPESAYKLAELFFPGPITIIVEAGEKIPDIVRAGGTTVGLRCPAHPVTLEIIKKAGVPLAAPSANISGQPSPKCAGDVMEYFDGKIECIVDGGKCTLGVESTIVDVTGTVPKILRQGFLASEKIFEALK